jgi:predicted amidohydrolase
MLLTALVAQFPVTLSIHSNLQRMDAVLEQARAGDLVVFPEGAVSGYATDNSFLEDINAAELASALEHLRHEAVRRSIHIWAGACMRLDGGWFNTAQGLSPDGRVQTYLKINLATHERGTFSAGSELPVFELHTPGGLLKVGVQICRELRFPEQWGWLARQGAQVFLHLDNAVGIDTVQPVWRSHLVSRAAETGRFVLSANNAAPKQICPTIAIAPSGQIMGEIVSAEPGVLRVELELSQVSDMYLVQSRSDVVAFASKNAQDPKQEGSYENRHPC